MFGFKIGETKIIIRFSFLLFNGIIFLFRDSDIILSFYLVCIIHELGHITAVYFFKGEIKSVELSGYGIRIETSPILSVFGGTVILLSGPLVNIVIFAVFKNNNFFSVLNLWEGIYNLLPFSFLDGGALIKLLTGGSPNEHTYEILRVAACVTATAIIVIFILL